MSNLRLAIGLLSRRVLVVAALTTLFLAAAGLSTKLSSGEDESMNYNHRAKGTFDVKLEPFDQQSSEDGLTLGRYGLDKTYHGSLEATARGEMLTVGTPVEGSAAYVAVERVEGTLDGKKGSFALQHRGVMGHGDQSLLVTVVVDSGTGQLIGLEGELGIDIVDGEHFYDLRYSLPVE